MTTPTQPHPATPARSRAQALVSENLTILASDLMNWRRKGSLPAKSLMFKVAKILEPDCPADDSMQQAEYLVMAASLEACATPASAEDEDWHRAWTTARLAVRKVVEDHRGFELDALMESQFIRDINSAFEVLWHATQPLIKPAHPPSAERGGDGNWCQYVAGMVSGWIGMTGQEVVTMDDDRRTGAIAGIIERRMWALAPLQRESTPASRPVGAERGADAAAEFRLIWNECHKVKGTTDGRKHAEAHALADWVMAHCSKQMAALAAQPAAVPRDLLNLWGQAGGFVPMGKQRPSERNFSGSLNTLARFADLVAAQPAAQQGVPVAWRWKNSVGDVVTDWLEYKPSQADSIKQQVAEEGGTVEYAYTTPQLAQQVDGKGGAKPMPDEAAKAWVIIRDHLNKPANYRDRIGPFVAWFDAHLGSASPQAKEGGEA